MTENTIPANNSVNQTSLDAKAPTEPQASVPSTPAVPAPVTQTVVVEKKGSSCWKIGLISCGVLFLVLILCACVGFLSLGILLRNSTTDNNFDKSKFSTYDPSSLSTTGTIQDKVDSAAMKNKDGTFTVTITEKELIEQIATGSNSEALKGVYISMEPNLLTLKIDLKNLLTSLPQNQRLGLDPASFDGVYITAEVTTSSDGKTFIVKKVATGNTFFDSFLGHGFASGFEEGLNQGISESLSSRSYTLEKISIKENAIDLTFRDNINNLEQNNSNF